MLAIALLQSQQNWKLATTIAAHEAVEWKTFSKLLDSVNPAHRGYATHALGQWDEIPDALKLISARTSDDSPRVRLEAVVAAAKVQSPEAIKVALKVLDKPMDSYIERALWLAVHATKKHWFPAMVSEDAEPFAFFHDMRAKHIAFLFKHDGSPQLMVIANALAQRKHLPENLEEGLTLALAKDNASELTAAEAKRLKDAGDDRAKLIAFWRERDRLPKLADAAMTKLVKVAPDEAVQLIMAPMPKVTSTEAMQSLLAPILPVEAANKALVAALKTKPCTADTAKLIMRVLTSTGRSEPELMATMTSILGASSPVPSYSAEFVNTLAAEVKAKGNAAHGKAIFHSTLVNCTACHSIAKKGGTIGPELDAVGRGVPIELLIEAVVWPNRQIKEGYVATTIKTKDGRVLQGYKVSDANGELQLRDLLSKTVTKFAASEIETRTDAGSLMPEGLVALMTRDELRDLIAYLMTLGR